MVCETEDAINQIKRLGDNAYDLRMVLLSIAQTNPEVIVRTVNKIKGECEELDCEIKEVLKHEGKLRAIKLCMKKTGVRLEVAHSRIKQLLYE